MMGRGQKAGLAVLCLLVALAGLRWGLASQPWTETEIIEAMTARYIAETGGQAVDCYGRPGPDGLAFLTVYCEGSAGRFVYPSDRFGRLVAAEEGGV